MCVYRLVDEVFGLLLLDRWICFSDKDRLGIFVLVSGNWGWNEDQKTMIWVDVSKVDKYRLFHIGSRAFCSVRDMAQVESSIERASGGCLGAWRRWRTCYAAKSFGELRKSFDPKMSEWGNPPFNGILHWIHRCWKQTQGTEISKYLEERKSTRLPQ